MNLKEYNYCKRHHHEALSRFLGIPINSFDISSPHEINFHDATCFEYQYTAKCDSEDVTRFISLIYLM